MFFKSKNGADRWLIVGLGNPESRYDNTRHNIGFAAVDYMAEKLGVTFNKKKFNAIYADTVWGDEKVLIVKPLTYMNHSGEAVAEFASFFKIPNDKIIVVFDDVSFDVGKIRIRRKGSAGGHNGIKSIIECLGSEDFPRVKIGVGAKPHKDYDMASWVLSKFPADDSEGLKKAVENTYKATSLILKNQIDSAMNRYTS